MTLPYRGVMAKCDQCGEHENMPYRCRHCGGTYCGNHRLPENHECPGLDQWEDPQGVFDSGFDDSVANPGGESSGGVLSSLGLGGGRSGIAGYFRGNMTYVFLGIMWITFALQWLVLFTLGPTAHNQIFVISPEHPLYVWTWVTSIFSHNPGGLFHIAGNSIVIFFFGRLVEDYVGSKEFTALFLVSGIVAGLGQMGLSLAMGSSTGALGASGAALAILATLTVLNPSLRVYLYFLFPVPIWAITGFYAVYSAFFVTQGAIGAGGTAQAAHLVGLLIGLAYGQYAKSNIRAPSQIEFGGGGPGGGGPGGRGRGPF